MKEVVPCPNCPTSLNVPQRYSGTIRCPKCNSVFRVGLKSKPQHNKKTGYGIIIGFGMLMIYWSVIFAIATLNTVVIQKEIIDHPVDSNDEQESAEVDPVCDFMEDSYDAEECELLHLEGKRNTALIGMIGPGIHFYAFFLIHRDVKALSIEKDSEDPNS